jgi:spermidine synthase
MVDFDLSAIYNDIEIYKNITIKKINRKSELKGSIFEFYNTDYSGKDYYHIIRYNNKTLMSNDPFEVMTNQIFFEKSKGDILIFGLGLGWIIFPILDRDDIKSITVVEKNTEIIEFVGDILSKKDVKNKLNIIEGDVYDYYNHLDKKFDFIYFDTYDTPDLSITDIDKLNPLYQKFLNDGGISHFWCQEIRHIIN